MEYIFIFIIYIYILFLIFKKIEFVGSAFFLILPKEMIYKSWMFSAYDF